ncbi:MAG: sialate O-acetylesterase [Planctomycetes bacterium]|nr:sialate O-acetylesterase [Planctomycetota bacterium]
MTSSAAKRAKGGGTVPARITRAARGGTLLAVVVAAGWGPARWAAADVALGRLFGDHMVLQCERPFRIWGSADPGEEVVVSIAGQRAGTKADGFGRWIVELPAQPPGGPHELVATGRTTARSADVFFGEVWLGSGQSNMVWILTNSQDGGRENDAADFPRIRTFTVGERPSDQPQLEPPANAFNGPSEWRVCGPRKMGYISAVAYFFARELHRELDRPVGIIVSASNGTRIEPWTRSVTTPVGPELSDVPPSEYGTLYNGMIYPVMPLAKRGVIWYQGEGNVGDGMKYTSRMRALISGWRAAAADPAMPFYFVQLAPLNWGGKPIDELPKIWEAQTAALAEPGTGMIVTNDIGNTGDAHPRNKRDVGIRLARLALQHTYGRDDMAADSPLYDAMRVDGALIRVRFRHAGRGLKTRDDGPPRRFTIAGADRQFVPAETRIEGDEVVVWSEQVPDPVAVRFAWHQTAVHNLVNDVGLPASPFRTDAW